MVDLSSNNVSVLAGTGAQGSLDAAIGLNAQFYEPYSAALSQDSSVLLVGVSLFFILQLLSLYLVCWHMFHVCCILMPFEHSSSICPQDKYAIRAIDLTTTDNSVTTIAGTRTTGGLAVPALALEADFHYVKSMAIRPSSSSFLYFVDTGET